MQQQQQQIDSKEAHKRHIDSQNSMDFSNFDEDRLQGVFLSKI